MSNEESPGRPIERGGQSRVSPGTRRTVMQPVEAQGVTVIEKIPPFVQMRVFSRVPSTLPSHGDLIPQTQQGPWSSNLPLNTFSSVAQQFSGEMLEYFPHSSPLGHRMVTFFFCRTKQDCMVQSCLQPYLKNKCVPVGPEASSGVSVQRAP